MTTAQFTCPGLSMPQPADAPPEGYVACYRAGHTCTSTVTRTEDEHGGEATRVHCACCGDLHSSMYVPAGMVWESDRTAAVPGDRPGVFDIETREWVLRGEEIIDDPEEYTYELFVRHGSLNEIIAAYLKANGVTLPLRAAQPGTVTELTERLVAASSEWDDNTGDDETSRPYLEHLARAVVSWGPVPAEAGDSTADEMRKLTVTGPDHGYYHADCPCGWRSVRSDVADVACEWSDHTCTPGFASSVRDTAETTRYFVGPDAFDDTILWRGTGPDDPNCRVVASKGELDGLDRVLWSTLVKALTGQDAPDGARVVTICGSMRFFDDMLKVAEEETAAGRIVLAPFSVVAPEDQGGEFKQILDDLHRRKIDLSSEIIVVTRDGYIGESTRGEIEYAEKHGKTVQHVDVQADTAGGAS